MESTLEINGKKLHLIKDVVGSVSYSRDHITRLAREGKIFATNIGRNWFVDIDSLKNYEEFSKVELDIRKKQLSDERKNEMKIAEASIQKQIERATRLKKIEHRAAVVATLVLTIGLLTGWSTYNFLSTDHSPTNQLANTTETRELPFVERDILLDEESTFALASDVVIKTTLNQEEAVSSMRPIDDEIKNGVLLLPHGSVTASATEMFSDEVTVLTSADGSQVVVRLDENGRPKGNVIPFVTVPVNHLEI
jgi:hypothetical protein